MNIFALDKDPKKAAQYLCDKHVPKMVLESAQLLCSAFEIETPYRKTHLNHPSSLWVRNSKNNYAWLLVHSYELANEYTRRFGKVHKSLEVIKWCDNHKGNIIFPKINITPFAQVMPEKYQSNDPIISYRKYYIEEKLSFAKWRLGKPFWILDKNISE